MQVVYLVQGRASRIESFAENLSPLLPVIFLAWDRPIEFKSKSLRVHHDFFPNSSWAEGRNRLLVLAKEKYPNFNYLIFCDDDAEVKEGDLQKLEKLLFEFNPKIAFPLSDSIKNQLNYSNRKVERAIRHDQILQAFRRDVVDAGIVLPYDLEFDSISWHLTCELNQYLIQRFYFGDSLTFNEIEVTNGHHEMMNMNSPETVFVSRYLGKYSRADLESLKEYVEVKYGRQPRHLDTIFQPVIFSKLRLVNLNKKHIGHFLYLLRFDVKRAPEFGVKLLSTVLINIAYSVFAPKLHFKAKTDIRK